jgi:Outer membrane protein beta-barrel domain
MKKIITLLAIAVLSASQVSYAQLGKRAKQAATRAAAKRVASFTNTRSFPSTFKYSVVGFGFGYVNYFGDLAPEVSRSSTSFNQATPSFSAFYGKRISPSLTVKVFAAYNYLAADDAKVDKTSISGQSRYLRNLSFRNQIKEFGVTLQGDILPTNRGYMRRNFLNPYGYAGLSIFTNNPEALGPKDTPWEDQWVELQPLKTEGQGLKGGPKTYSTIQIGVPIGFGVRYRLGNNWDLAFEIGYRLTFTNYLDDVGRNFYNFGVNQSKAENVPVPDDKGNLKLKTGEKNPIAEKSSFTELQVLMANRSAEAKEAASGAERTIPFYNGVTTHNIRIVDLVGGTSTNYTGTVSYTSADVAAATKTLIDYTPVQNEAGETKYIPHLRGYDNGSAPRGGGGRDYYLVTGFHLSYILHDQTRSPRFR